MTLEQFTHAAFLKNRAIKGGDVVTSKQWWAWRNWCPAMKKHYL